MSPFSFERLSLSFFLCGVLSLYLSPLLAGGGIPLDFLLLFLLFYTFTVDWKKAPWLGFLIGSIEDLFSSAPLGLHGFSFAVSSLALSLLLGKLDREIPATQILLSFLFCWMLRALEIHMVLWLQAWPDLLPLSWEGLWRESLWVALLSRPFALLLRVSCARGPKGSREIPSPSGG